MEGRLGTPLAMRRGLREHRRHQGEHMQLRKLGDVRIGFKIFGGFAAVIVIFLAVTGYQIYGMHQLGLLQEEVSTLAMTSDGARDAAALQAADRAYVELRDQSIRNAAVTAGGAALLGIILATAISMAISRPLRKAADFALGISKGDIDNDLDIRQMDEVGGVCWALRRAAESLRSVLGEFDTVTEDIVRGRLDRRGDAERFDGAFGSLISDANRMIDELVQYVDAVPMPVMTIDTEYRVQFMNKAGRELSGKALDELKAMRCHEVMRTGHCNTPDCGCAKAMQDGQARRAETDASPGGSGMMIEYHAIPNLDRDGNIVGGIEVVVDQTSVKAAQQQMQVLASEAGDISERLSSAAEELSAQVEESSKGAELQRERASETATAMEQMNATVMEVAQNATNAAENADSAREKARQGAEVVQDVVRAITGVRSQTDRLKDNMAGLGTQVEDIGRIMNVITDIADQTNLLALNAAIEAARAGEAGRGFAVVADEVRKLAEKTMTATKEVGQAITAIQDGAKTSITETEGAAKAVAESADMANTSGMALEEILHLVEGTADQVRAIATASEEQSAATEQINRAAEEINTISTETSDSMAQSSQAIMELADLARRLQELIERMQA